MTGAARSTFDSTASFMRGKRRFGFTRFELMVVLIVFAIITGVFANRLAYYQEAAERAQMESQINSMRSALRLKVASLLVSGRAYEYPQLLVQNPMDWLDEKPANYIGVVRSADAEQVGAGTWYYEPDAKMIIYVIRNGNGFQSTSGGRKQVRLRLQLTMDDAVNTSTGHKEKIPSAVTLQLVEPYRWF